MQLFFNISGSTVIVEPSSSSGVEAGSRKHCLSRESSEISASTALEKNNAYFFISYYDRLVNSKRPRKNNSYVPVVNDFFDYITLRQLKLKYRNVA